MSLNKGRGPKGHPGVLKKVNTEIFKGSELAWLAELATTSIKDRLRQHASLNGSAPPPSRADSAWALFTLRGAKFQSLRGRNFLCFPRLFYSPWGPGNVLWHLTRPQNMHSNTYENACVRQAWWFMFLGN